MAVPAEACGSRASGGSSGPWKFNARPIAGAPGCCAAAAKLIGAGTGTLRCPGRPVEVGCETVACVRPANCSSSAIRFCKFWMYVMHSSRKLAVFARSAWGTTWRSRSSLHATLQTLVWAPACKRHKMNKWPQACSPVVDPGSAPLLGGLMPGGIRRGRLGVAALGAASSVCRLCVSQHLLLLGHLRGPREQLVELTE